MSLLAFRRVILNVGLPGEEGLSFSSGEGSRGYRISFGVKFTSRSRPNRAKIKVYNLSPRSIELLEREGAFAQLVAGYKARTSLLIKGDITTVEHSTTENDRVTEITVKDAGLLYRSAQFNWYYEEGTTNRQILADIARQSGLGLGFGVDTIPLIAYPGDVTFFGPARTALDELLGDLDGAEWSIVDGNLQVMLGDDESTAENGVLLNAGSGKIKVARKKKGVEVTSLMQPQIRPGRLIRVISRDITGDFVSRVVEHVGDSADGEFVTKIMARRISSTDYPRE